MTPAAAPDRASSRRPGHCAKYRQFWPADALAHGRRRTSLGAVSAVLALLPVTTARSRGMIARVSAEQSRDGVSLTNLSQPLFDGAGAVKGDLVDYLDAVRERILPALRDRPLSVI